MDVIYSGRSYGAHQCHGCRNINFVRDHDTTKKYFCPKCVLKNEEDKKDKKEKED